MVDWNKDVKLSDLFGRGKNDEDAGEASAPLPEEQPAAPAAEAVVTPTQPPLPTPIAAVPPQPVAPAPAPAPGIHPPVPAAELEAADAGEDTVPFWKRDLSLGGGKKKERAPKEKKQKQTKAPRAAKRTNDKAAAQPFWKRELSVGKKQKVAAEPAAEEQPKSPPAAKKKDPRPFYKRDISFGKPAAARAQKRHKRLVGLKVGGSQVAAARVSNNGVPELVQVARADLEPGIVVGGELRDPDALAESLKEFFKEHKLPKQGVRLGVANNRIGVRIFEVDGIDDPKQLENAIRFRAQEALPIPIEEAVLDFHVLDERIDEEGQPVKRVMLVVAYRDLVDRYTSACRKAGIRLAGIDLEAFALLRALAEPLASDSGQSNAAIVVVSIGHDRSTFAVSDGRICEFTRVLDWGGAALNVGVARALQLAPSEAEPYKRAISLSHEDTPEGMTDEQAAAARDALRKGLQGFARELVSSLQFYQNQPGSLGIGEIVITGGTAHLHGLAEELQKLIGVRVRVGDPLTRVKLGKRVGEAEQVGSLAVAIGLGIED
jgi:type IV pilus assembly protein PilM